MICPHVNRAAVLCGTLLLKMFDHFGLAKIRHDPGLGFVMKHKAVLVIVVAVIVQHCSNGRGCRLVRFQKDNLCRVAPNDWNIVESRNILIEKNLSGSESDHVWPFCLFFVSRGKVQIATYDISSVSFSLKTSKNMNFIFASLKNLKKHEFHFYKL